MAWHEEGHTARATNMWTNREEQLLLKGHSQQRGTVIAQGAQSTERNSYCSRGTVNCRKLALSSILVESMPARQPMPD
jgi:hypothetical protein